VTPDRKKSAPLYQQIVEDIKNQIASGVLQAHEQIGSHNNLAQAYDVSLITVKKALNELINLRYLYSRVGKGTYVAPQNAGVDFSKNVTLGLVLRNLNSPFFARIVESVERYASELGLNLLISTSSNSRDKERQQIDKYLSLGVSGLILTSITAKTFVSRQVKDLHNAQFPYVIVAYVEDEDINYIGVDHELGAYLATEHLIRLGYQKIGYINSERGYRLGEVRKQGLLRALNDYKMPFDESFHFRLAQRGDWHDYDSGIEIAKDMVSRPDHPDAVFVYNDLAALGLQKGLLASGLAVPQDIAMVGFDNIKRGVVAPVPLTTVHQPVNEIGRLAIDMILKKIRGDLVKHRVILKPTLVIRESCGAQRRKTYKNVRDQNQDNKVYEGI
jgi:DNA-binding LacI/PurR family transcriptional regulator